MRRKDILLAGCIFSCPVAQEALSKIMGSAGRGILGQGCFTVPKKSNLQRAASHSLVKAWTKHKKDSMLHLFLKAPVYTMHKWTGVGKEMVQKYNSFLTAGPSHRVGSRHCKSHVKTRLGLRRRTPRGTHERIAGIAVPSLYYESYRRNRVEILAAPLRRSQWKYWEAGDTPYLHRSAINT